MNELDKKYKRVITNIRKASIESNGKHPPEETIHLYVMNVLSEAKMKELEAHFDYCWHCTDILADAEEFQQISEDVKADRVTIDANLPGFEKLKEMAFGKNAASGVKNEWQDWANALLTEVRAFITPSKLIPNFASSSFDSDKNRKLARLTLPNNLSEEIIIDYNEKENRLEIFSDNKDLEEKTIRITTADGNSLETIFRDKSFKNKSKPINAVFNNFNIQDVEDCKIEIV